MGPYSIQLLLLVVLVHITATLPPLEETAEAAAHKVGFITDRDLLFLVLAVAVAAEQVKQMLEIQQTQVQVLFRLVKVSLNHPLHVQQPVQTEEQVERQVVGLGAEGLMCVRSMVPHQTLSQEMQALELHQEPVAVAALEAQVWHLVTH